VAETILDPAHPQFVLLDEQRAGYEHCLREIDGLLQEGSLSSGQKRVIIVENNQSGQFARYLRSETGIKADGHIRKYDGEPFMPHHIVAGVQEQLADKTDLYVPTHEIMV
jgi:hypothetical protein